MNIYLFLTLLKVAVFTGVVLYGFRFVKEAIEFRRNTRKKSLHYAMVSVFLVAWYLLSFITFSQAPVLVNVPF